MKSPIKKGYMFLILLLLMAITGIVYIGTDGLRIKTINIEGNKRISRVDIIKKSGINYNESIFKLDKELIKNRIETDPYLEVISITRQFPDGVLITLKEKEGVAIIPYLNTYFIIDRECYIMEVTKDIKDFQYPLVQDVQVKNFAEGKKLATTEEYQVKVLSRILESIYDLELQSQISEIILEDPDDIYLILTDGMRTRVGQAIEIDDKLIWLKSQELKDVCQGIEGGILDLSAPSQPIFYPDES